MRSKLTLFAAVCVAALALSTPAGAATILQFSQQSSTDFVQATVTSTTTTLNTDGNGSPIKSIPITITQFGIAPMQSIPGTETFNPSLVGGVPSVANPTTAFGFTGTITIAIVGDPNVLTAVVTNGRLDANGGSGGFSAAANTSNNGSPTNVVLSSDNTLVIQAMGGSPAFVGTFTTLGAVSLSLVGISPLQTGSGFQSFTGQNTGNFSTVAAVPEPASFLSAGTAILAGLGCFGWSRRKSSKA